MLVIKWFAIFRWKLHWVTENGPEEVGQLCEQMHLVLVWWEGEWVLKACCKMGTGIQRDGTSVYCSILGAYSSLTQAYSPASCFALFLCLLLRIWFRSLWNVALAGLPSNSFGIIEVLSVLSHQLVSTSFPHELWLFPKCAQQNSKC